MRSLALVSLPVAEITQADTGRMREDRFVSAQGPGSRHDKEVKAAGNGIPERGDRWMLVPFSPSPFCAVQDPSTGNGSAHSGRLFPH